MIKSNLIAEGVVDKIANTSMKKRGGKLLDPIDKNKLSRSELIDR